MVGKLADGAFISQSTPVLANGSWPLYVGPYGGRGILIGWLSFGGYEGGSVVIWEKAPSAPGIRIMPVVFPLLRTPLTPYTPPPWGQNAVNWTNGMVVVDSGDLPLTPMTNQVALVKTNSGRSAGASAI